MRIQVTEFDVQIDVLRLLISVLLSVAIGGLGYWRGSLTISGWLGAIIVGSATAGLGGWTWGMLVVVFFVTSSALSHWRRESKALRTGGTVAKGERRDLGQTLANGGAAAFFAFVFAVEPHPSLFAAALGALATVTADTWATELGTLSTSPPRLVTTGRTVVAGTSGGITVLGFAATVCGALLIGVVAWLMSLASDNTQVVWAVPVALVGGIVGSLSDSLLGATVQLIKFCPQCSVETEQPIHVCGTTTVYYRGWSWLNNDWVNFLSSLLGAGASVLVWLLISV